MWQRLLVVDDSPAMQRFIARVVSISGLPFECTFASSGRDALDLLRKSKMDMVLTDFNMPMMDGEEFVGILQHDQDLRAIPIVVMSTDATRARVSRMAAAGVSGYLSKPFTAEIFRREMARVLGPVHD